MLMGQFRCTLDEKGRLNFPSRLRVDMGESFIVTRWLDDCLVAFPAAEWERIAALLGEKSVVKSRDISRFLYSGATKALPDAQGRILIPVELRQHAALQKDIVVIGVGRHAEIWSADAWQAAQKRMSSKAIAEAMEALDF